MKATRLPWLSAFDWTNVELTVTIRDVHTQVPISYGESSMEYHLEVPSMLVSHVANPHPAMRELRSWLPASCVKLV